MALFRGTKCAYRSGISILYELMNLEFELNQWNLIK